MNLASIPKPHDMTTSYHEVKMTTLAREVSQNHMDSDTLFTDRYAFAYTHTYMYILD